MSDALTDGYLWKLAQEQAVLIVGLSQKIEQMEARLARAEFDVLAVSAELAAHCTDHYEGQGHPGEAAMTELTNRVEALEALEAQKAGYAQFRTDDLPNWQPTITHDPPSHEDDDREPEGRP